MNSLFQKYATKRNLIALAILTVTCNVLLLLYFGDFEESPLDTYVYYTASEAYKAIDNYGVYNRGRYIRGTILLDFIYPIIYSLMLSFSLFRLKVRAGLAILPLWIIPMDYLENVTIIFLLSQFPQRYVVLASIAGVVTSMKWLMVVMTLLSIIILFVYRRTAGRSENNKAELLS